MKQIGILYLLMVSVAINLVAMNQSRGIGGTVVANYTMYDVFLTYKKEEIAPIFEVNKVEKGCEIMLSHYTPACSIQTFFLKVVDVSGLSWTWNVQDSVETQCYTYGSSRVRTLQIMKENNKIKIICYFYQEDDDSKDFKSEFIMDWQNFRQ